MGKRRKYNNWFDFVKRFVAWWTLVMSALQVVVYGLLMMLSVIAGILLWAFVFLLGVLMSFVLCAIMVEYLGLK